MPNRGDAKPGDREVLSTEISKRVEGQSEVVDSDVVHTEVQSVQFSGPLPPPEILQRYNQVLPSAAERILAMAEAQSVHRKELERRIAEAEIEDVRAQRRETRLGQVCGAMIVLAGLGAGTYAAVQGAELSGVIVAVAGLGAIVTAFVLGRTPPSTSKERSETESSTE